MDHATFEIVKTIAFALIVIVVVLAQFASKGKYRELFERQANKRNGSYKKSIFYPKFSLPFEGKDVIVKLVQRRKNSPPDTSIECKLQLMRDIKMVVYPKHALSSLAFFVGMKKVQTNDPAFDEKFVVYSKEEMVVLSFLTHSIKETLLKTRLKNPCVTIHPKKFVFSTNDAPKSDEEFDERIDAALTVLKQILII